MTIAASAPKPSESCSMASAASAGSSARDAPRRSASSRRAATGSTPMTSQPAARRSWTVIRPRRPRPTTTTRSPNSASARRSPCMAMAPRVVKRGVARLHPGRGGREQVGGDGDDLGVLGGADSRAGDQRAGLEAGDAAGVDHDPGARVTDRVVLGHRVLGLGEGGLDAALAHALHRLADELGVAESAGRQRLAAAAGDGGALGPGGDDRGERFDQRAALGGAGSRVVDEGGGAAAGDDLLHGFVPRMTLNQPKRWRVRRASGSRWLSS